MDKLNKSLEFLKLLSATTSETLIIKGNNENCFKLIKASVETLFTTCDENNYDVRLTADENLNQLVKELLMAYSANMLSHGYSTFSNDKCNCTRLIIVYLDLIKKFIQLLRYSNLFDFDQLLISTQIESIEEIRVGEVLKTDITYLLSLCEHGDLHLRGACANLLVTLIQTTIHLLILSSLSNSFINYFINQYSLVSTDSQDSSSHAFTIIGIKLLEDSIQHTTSSCTLAKFALVQLMDDIDFRILTYLEQQLKQQYPDIRVRQAIASTFAKPTTIRPIFS
ncbi:unnamed protein product [Rotaria sp. Silwood1]|nr:unnamed protein product [Rotaria sp. Silwood1]CAF1685684.1 unnamed protein product [Rotaria sp. Silwood1]